jgi:sugar lactone lactonase YvrE
MVRRCFAFLLGTFVLSTAHAQAQSTVPTIYVSTFNGGQILAINGTTGATSVLFTGGVPPVIVPASFAPEDLVVGPDGMLYICDSLNRTIWRFNPGLSPSSTNPQVVATFPSGVFPEGPSFSGSDDLYVNTRGVGEGPAADGVWVIPGIATPGAMVPVACPSAVPPLCTQIIPSIGTFGEGTAFAATGHLLMVDRSGSRVLSAKARPAAFPNFGPSFTQLITTNLSSAQGPIGIAVNTCGDVLVGTGNQVQRFTLNGKDPMTGELLPATFQNTYVTFGDTDLVTYMERDASNTLWVATTNNSETGNGKLWKILPVLNPASDPISSCTTGVPPDLNNPFDFFGEGTLAVGVAITPTNFTPALKTFTAANPSNTFNFGHYTLTVTYRQILTTFSQTFTAVMKKPTDVSFANPPFRPGTNGMRFPSLGGFVIEFQNFGSPPVAGTNFAPTDATGAAIKIVVAFHDPVRGFRQPGLAHALDCGEGCPPFTDDITTDFWFLTDQADGGDIPCWCSRYVTFDEPFLAGLALPLQVELNEPAQSGHPLFNLGQNFTVSITVRDAQGSRVNGLVNRVSAARLSGPAIALQTVQATNAPTQGNVMDNHGNGRYSIGIDTGVFTGGIGTYQFTISGDGFPPFVFTEQFTR